MVERSDEAEDVIAVAAEYYRAMVEADGDALRRVFHPRASVVGHFAGGLEYASLEEFIAGTGDAKTGPGPFEYRLENLLLEGDTALATVGGYSYGHWFTDHLSMIKIEGAWRIVCKTFYCYPEAYRP